MPGASAVALRDLTPVGQTSAAMTTRRPRASWGGPGGGWGGVPRGWPSSCWLWRRAARGRAGSQAASALKSDPVVRRPERGARVAGRTRPTCAARSRRAARRRCSSRCSPRARQSGSAGRDADRAAPGRRAEGHLRAGRSATSSGRSRTTTTRPRAGDKRPRRAPGRSPGHARSSSSTRRPQKRKKSGSGGAVGAIVALLLILAVAAGGAFLLVSRRRARGNDGQADARVPDEARSSCASATASARSSSTSSSPRPAAPTTTARSTPTTARTTSTATATSAGANRALHEGLEAIAAARERIAGRR